MNERIKELLKQSGLQPYYDAQEGQIEKFAQLIVEECAEVGYRTHDDFMVKVKIKEHFGVEE